MYNADLIIALPLKVGPSFAHGWNQIWSNLVGAAGCPTPLAIRRAQWRSTSSKFGPPGNSWGWHVLESVKLWGPDLESYYICDKVDKPFDIEIYINKLIYIFTGFTEVTKVPINIGLANQNFWWFDLDIEIRTPWLYRGLFSHLKFCSPSVAVETKPHCTDPPRVITCLGLAVTFSTALITPKQVDPWFLPTLWAPKLKHSAASTSQSSWLDKSLLQVPGRQWHQARPRIHVCGCCKYIHITILSV